MNANARSTLVRRRGRRVWCTVQPARLSVVAVVAALVALAAGCGAPEGQAVHVRLQFTDPDPAHALSAVSVMAGGDKFSWPQIAGGEVRTVTLHPGANDDRQAVLLFELNGRRQAWDGPKVTPGTGYRIHITVDAAGQAHHRHCLLPCVDPGG